MSDLYQPTVTTPSQGEPPAEPQAQETAEAKYITLEEAQRLAHDAAEKALRKAQSYVDKGVKGKSEKMDQVVAELRKQNVPISEAEEKAMRDALATTWDQPDAKPAKQQAAQPPQDPISALAMNKMEKAGVYIMDTDPEVNNLDQSDELAFLESIDRAIEQKRARLAASGKPPEVRVPGMTTGTPAHSETMDQIQTKLNALMVEPTRNMAEIRQLQQKLRQMISAGR